MINFQFFKFVLLIHLNKNIFYRYEWITDSDFFDVLKDGFQTLCIPKSGTYKFELIAPGLDQETSGARVCGSVNLKQVTGQTS